MADDLAADGSVEAATDLSGHLLARSRGGQRAALRPALPSGLQGARLGVRPAAVVAFALVALLVVGVLGTRAWMAQGRATPVPLAHVGTSEALSDHLHDETGDQREERDEVDSPIDSGALPVGEDGEHGAPGSNPDGVPVPDLGSTPEVVVHLAGGVQAPGVYQVLQGDRVQDAVAAAGGLSADADPSRVNLARMVSDGEWIWIPVQGEDPPELVPGLPGQAPAWQQPGPTDPAPSSPAATTVDLNAADQAALEQLPGVGPKTAASILAWREENGRFTAAEELLEIRGIGPRTLEELRPHLRW